MGRRIEKTEMDAGSFGSPDRSSCGKKSRSTFDLPINGLYISSNLFTGDHALVESKYDHSIPVHLEHTCVHSLSWMEKREKLKKQHFEERGQNWIVMTSEVTSF